jgi:hypothetical protein
MMYELYHILRNPTLVYRHRGHGDMCSKCFQCDTMNCGQEGPVLHVDGCVQQLWHHVWVLLVYRHSCNA